MKAENCFYCGTPTVKVSRNGHITSRRSRDHLTPVALGGSGADHNIVISCVQCNCDKGDLTVDEYRILLAYRHKKFEPFFAAALLKVAEVVQPFWGDHFLARKKLQASWEEADREPVWKINL